MPRPQKFSTEDLTERALVHFWAHGYHATSMDALVRATGLSRHGIYSALGGKRALFLACFERYGALVVTPAFEGVERADAGIDAIARYFETQISLAETQGLPGRGCFVGNAATEVAPADAEVRAKVLAHNTRLQRGFAAVLSRECNRDAADIIATAGALTVFAQGLWASARLTEDAGVLRQSARTALRALTEGLR